MVKCVRVNSENNNPSEIPLHFAVRNGDIEIVQMLLRKGANIDAKNSSSNTPLHIAVVFMKIEIIGILLNESASVEAANRSCISPLHIAVHVNSEEIINLLSKGANVNAKGIHGITSFHRAADRGYLRIVEQLLKYGANLNAAFTSGYREGCTSLHLAVMNHSDAMTKCLLSKGANVNAEGKHGITPLHFALNKRSRRDLQLAELLKYGANVNAAATCGWMEGYTLLHLAVTSRNEEIIKWLLSNGANVNAEGKDGMGPLHFAINEGDTKAVELLLKCGAKVDATSDFSKTPLHNAVKWCHLDIIELLLKFGASVNSTDEDGLTALHGASKLGREKVVTALLEHGSDITIMSKKNYTAFDFAMYGSGKEHDKPFYNDRHVNIIRILKRHMVKTKVANLYAVNNDLLSISSPTFGSDDEELNDFQNECENELANMKSEVINDNITFYDILTESVRQVALYTSNESIVEAFGSDK